MKEYVGKFPVNKGLTKKLNYKGFLIYRDPDHGLYAYNPEMKIDVNLMQWNLRVKDFNDKIRRIWIEDIELNIK